MFAMVFTTRYLDLLTNFISPYNSVMKVFVYVKTNQNCRNESFLNAIGCSAS